MAGSILGTRVLRTEDPELLLGQGQYVADLPLDRPLPVVPLAAAERYAAQFQDGVRVEAAEVLTWHDVAAAPTIGGKPVFDPKKVYG